MTPSTTAPIYAKRKHTTRKINKQNHHKWLRENVSQPVSQEEEAAARQEDLAWQTEVALPGLFR